MAVTPARHGQGVAGRLLEAVEDELRARGCAVATLETTEPLRRAIRFYESKGLLSPQRVGANRVYNYRDRARLLIILRGKRLGFSLSRIQEYLSLYDADPTHKGQLEHLLAGTQRRIEELESQRADLELTIEELREIEELTLDAIAKLPQTQRRKNSRKR